ncbi:terminase small subunit [Gemmata sp. JC717]|uniref:terminase small subunit n=1 Tax=Gemmata algarum TaxID=2975278 RepID=UPI0021BACB1D|nr:terminase small subunit [Gemmata algarum]MDY3551419.1 terminase small subunit [Gemmata algarum]
MTSNLTPKQEKFVQEYLIDLNATQAAIRAGYSEKTANEQGSRLLANVSVSQAIQRAMQERSKRTAITQDDVLQRWWDIATAEVNEVIQYRRVCCRYCHGEGHAYQWKDAAEFRHKLAAVAADEKATDESLPTDEGGYGFNPTLDPHPGCPSCFGEGHGEVIAADTRKLTGKARLIYDGVKITDRGFEVKTLDRAKALENVARHLGMFNDKLELAGKLAITHEDALTQLAEEGPA